MALQDKKIMPPPWLAHREIERYSIGWRMGYGEDYIDRFGDWLDTLSPEERTAGDRAMFQAFLSLPEVRQTGTFFLFWGIAGLEPDTGEIKTQFEKEKLAQDRIKTKNQLDANIQRLNYSLDIANAAGIKKPVYSNGQAVKDDPDFSISLGADGIGRKLEIEKAVTDVAELNGELRNRQYLVEQLTKANVDDVKFIPFKYQLSPSLPVKKDGPGKAIIVILSALIGGMVACGGVLLRHAMASRKQDAMMADHLV